MVFGLLFWIFLYGTFGASSLGLSPLSVHTPRPPFEAKNEE